MAPLILPFFPQITQIVNPILMKVKIIKSELDVLIQKLKETLEIFEQLIQEDALHLHEGSRNMLFL